MSTDTSFDLQTLIRPNIAKMKPYSSARDEFQGEAEVFLDANENPYPSPYNRYPDPLQLAIKKKLAPLKDVSPDQIFLGNGSDEPIDLLIRAFCEPNRDEIIITAPTYGMYAVCAEVNAVGIRSVPLTETFDIDTAQILSTVTPETRLIFLCSPNNPTAASLSRDRIQEIIRSFRGIVVVDEAYIDFTSEPSFLRELSSHPNLVVLQTFSKAWGLAALRCGMAYASPAIIRILNKIKYPYNINIETQRLVLAALATPERKDAWVREILEQRAVLEKALSEVPVVEKVFPSDANFLLARVRKARDVYEYLMKKKIIVRDRSNVKLCDNCLRITVGTPEENQRLVDTLKSLK